MDMTNRRLPDSELEVMQAVWRCDAPVSRKDIEAVLMPQHPMALTTLLTLLTRLAEKGFLRIDKTGRSSVYTPLVTEQAYLAGQSNRFFTKLCGGNLSTFATALCDGGLTAEELDELKRLLEEHAL